jgi:hypothetical protein
MHIEVALSALFFAPFCNLGVSGRDESESSGRVGGVCELGRVSRSDVEMADCDGRWNEASSSLASRLPGRSCKASSSSLRQLLAADLV